MKGRGTLNLSNLNGRSGFALSGTHVSDRSGVSVRGSGDFYGDGVGPFNDPCVGSVRHVCVALERTVMKFVSTFL